MIATRTFHSVLGESAAVARLDELVAEWSRGPDPGHPNDADVTGRVERPSPHRATFWADAGGIELGASVELTPTPNGTTVTATVDTFRHHSRMLTATGRPFRKRLLQSYLDDLEQQFALDPPDRPGRRTEQMRAASTRQHDEARRPDRAIDAPGVRAFLRRRRQFAVALFLCAAVATVLLPVFTGVAQRRHDHLVRAGVDTTAVVTDYHVGKSTWVDLRFHVDGAEHTSTFDAPDDVYRRGDEVAVRVLRDGSYLEIDGEDFDALATDPAAFSLVGAMTFWCSALFLTRRVHRHRRDLTGHRFISIPVSAYHLVSNGRLAIVTYDNEHRRPLRLAHLATGKVPRGGWQALQDPGRILTAGPPDRTSIALLPPDRLVHVSRTRNPLRRWWWRRRLRRTRLRLGVDESTLAGMTDTP